MAFSRYNGSMSKRNLPVDFDCVYLHFDGQSSWRVSVDRPSNADAVFIPKSQGTMTLNSDGKTYTLTIPQWLAEDRGLA